MAQILVVYAWYRDEEHDYLGTESCCVLRNAIEYIAMVHLLLLHHTHHESWNSGLTLSLHLEVYSVGVLSDRDEIPRGKEYR